MTKVTVEIPGKIMLAGEYAVMAGMPCIAAATSLTMKVSVAASPSRRLRLVSELWPVAREYDSLAELGDSPFEQAVAAGLSEYHALEVVVISDLKVSYGVGSSSALRLGVLVAISSFLKECVPSAAGVWQSAHLAWQIQRGAQGKASGYDVATQVAGGWVVYEVPQGDMNQNAAKPVSGRPHDVKVLVGGKGEPTAPRVGSTFAQIMAHPDGEAFLDASRALVALWSGPETGLNELVKEVARHRKFLEAFDLVPLRVSRALTDLAGVDEAWSYKTTGAGGEDAILLVGNDQALAAPLARMAELGWHEIPSLLSGTGLNVDFDREERL